MRGKYARLLTCASECPDGIEMSENTENHTLTRKKKQTNQLETVRNEIIS